MTLALVQPFGLRSPGGGPRIMRALMTETRLPTLSVCTGVQPPPPGAPVAELHLPGRPRFGRLETTRLQRQLTVLELPFGPALRRRLEALGREHEVKAVHGVAHTTDFWWAYEASRTLGVPFLLSVHDDLAWALHDRLERRFGVNRLARSWQAADQRYVISERMGAEYGQRYGARDYAVVTDGLDVIAEQPRPIARDALRVYFMGAFHLSYRPNLDALVRTLLSDSVAHRWPDRFLTLRCGQVSDYEFDPRAPVAVLPFADEASISADLEDANVLYLPLPFGPEHRDFARLSLSTKLVTYLGSGIPILCHGPADSAAARLLAEHDAGVVVDTPEASAIVAGLSQILDRGPELAANALALARSQFRAQTMLDRFWGGVLAAVSV